MSFKGKIVFVPVLQHRQRTLLGQKSQEWDRYFKSVGLSKLGDLLATPLIEEMVYEFFDRFDLEKRTSCVQGQMIHVCPKTFELSLGAAFGSDGRGHCGFVPPNRAWDAPREWSNRFGEGDSRRDTQRSDGWRTNALKPEKKDIYQILVRAVLMKCDCTHISNALATALVNAEKGGEYDHAVNWATYCYDNFVKEMQRIVKTNGKAIKTVIGQLVCKILSDSGVVLLTRHSSPQLGTQSESLPITELISEADEDSQSDEECVVVDPDDVENFAFERRAREPLDPDCEKKRKLASPDLSLCLDLPPALSTQPDPAPMLVSNSEADGESRSDGECVIMDPADVEKVAFKRRGRDPQDKECKKKPNFASPDLSLRPDLPPPLDTQPVSFPYPEFEFEILQIDLSPSPDPSPLTHLSLLRDPSLSSHLPLNPSFGSGSNTPSVSQDSEDGPLPSNGLANQEPIIPSVLGEAEPDADNHDSSWVSTPVLDELWLSISPPRYHDPWPQFPWPQFYRRHGHEVGVSAGSLDISGDSAGFRSEEEAVLNLWLSTTLEPASIRKEHKHGRLRPWMYRGVLAFSAVKLSGTAQATVMDLWRLWLSAQRMCRAIILQQRLG